MTIREHEVHRWGGAALALGNLLFIVNNLDELSQPFFSRPLPDLISGEDMLLIAIGQVLLITGYLAFYRYYVQRVYHAGRNALRLFCGGGIVLAIGHVSFMSGLPEQVDFAFILVFVGLLTLLAGLLWFGAINLRRPVLARWRWLPLATGLMGFVAFVLRSGEVTKSGFQELRALFALGLVGLGLALWLERPVQSESSVLPEPEFQAADLGETV